MEGVSGRFRSITGAPWIFIVFPILHVAAGAAITYTAIAGFLNRTILELTPQYISVRFEPLPWIGAQQLKTEEIKQLYCKEKTKRSKNGTYSRYELFAVTAANKGVKLVGGLENPDTALFFEQQLERWMRIADHPVEGELAR